MRRTRPGRDQHGQRQALARPHQPAQQRQRRRVEVMRIVGAQHHRAVGAQLVDVVKGRVGRVGVRGQVTQELIGDRERVVAPARLARHPHDLRRAGRDSSQDLPDQEGLPDARRALYHHAYPGRRPPFDDAEHQVPGGPLDGSAIGRQQAIAVADRHPASISRIPALYLAGASVGAGDWWVTRSG